MITRVLEACDASANPSLGPMVRIAINTGMRRGELPALEWERVSLSTSTITLYQTKSGGEAQAVPINGAVYDALVALEPEQVRGQGPVFPREDGGTWREVRRPFLATLELAGIDGFRWHDLRHTCASWLVMSGRTLRDVREVLGHGDLDAHEVRAPVGCPQTGCGRRA